MKKSSRTIHKSNRNYTVTYYKILSAGADKWVTYKSPHRRRELSRQLIYNELISIGIVRRYNIPENWVEKVSVHKSSCYWSFGARFSIETGGFISDTDYIGEGL